MVSVASQLIEEVTAHAQSDSLKDAQEVCTDGTYFPNNLRILCIFSFVLHFLGNWPLNHKVDFIYDTLYM